jgi:hypothetical protein
MVSNTTKKIIKVSLVIIVILLVIGIIGFTITSKQPKIEHNETTNSTSINYEEKTTVSGRGALLLGVIFITVLIILFYIIRRSPDFYRVLTDEETIAVSKEMIVNLYNFNFENKQGSVTYYLSYYNGGDKRYPRAIVGWNLKQRSDAEGSIEPLHAHIVAIDLSRKNPERDHQFLGSLTKDEALKYMHDLYFGRLGQSVDPIKQERIILSEAEQEAIEELKKEKLKEEVKKNDK